MSHSHLAVLRSSSRWRALTAIPYATTVTYGDQAARLGHAGKARAVGAANGQPL